MKKYESKIGKLEKKKKFVRFLKYYPLIGLILMLTFVAFDIVAMINGLWALGGALSGLAITAGITTLTFGIMDINELIDSKIESIDKKIEEAAKEDVYENYIYQKTANLEEDEKLAVIKELERQKQIKDKTLKNLNPNLDIEYVGDNQDFTL